jgi:hypothetical protein
VGRPDSARKPRIFIGLTEIAGYYANLSSGFQELGFESAFFNLYQHPFEYGGDETSSRFVRSIRWLRDKRSKLQYNRIMSLLLLGLQGLLQVLLLCWAAVRYDVFIMGFGSTFFPGVLRHYDLLILRLLKKKTICVFNGSDTRLPYSSGHMVPLATASSIDDCIKLTDEKKKSLRIIDKFASIIVNSTAAGHFHEREFVSSIGLGLPYHTLSPNKCQAVRENGNSVRILHAPSNLRIKGTCQIREIIESLRSKGYQIEFVEITGKPNYIVHEELSRCDFVVDQLYSDTPMAGFAAEAALHGKPAVVGGYYAGFIRRDVQAEWIPPSFYCHPDEVEQAIEKMVVDEDYRLELGRKAKTFVETYWTPKQVASRYVQLIGGNVPREWLFDPMDIRYLHGSGLSESDARELVRAVIQKGGVEALQLDDKPGLKDMFVAFAFGDRVPEC